MFWNLFQGINLFFHTEVQILVKRTYNKPFCSFMEVNRRTILSDSAQILIIKSYGMSAIYLALS